MATTPTGTPSVATSAAAFRPAPPRRDRLVKDLVACGLLDSADAVTNDVVLAPVGRSHAVWRLELSGRPVAAVKLFDPDQNETAGEAVREALVHALGRRVPELARLLPETWPHRGAPELLVTRWFEGRAAETGDAPGASGPSTTLDDLGAAGALIAPDLARMHRATARLVRDGGLDGRLARAEPWVLRLFDGDAPAEIWANPRLRPLMDHAAARPAFVAGLRRARGAWRAVALIHGDLKHDNLLVSDGGRALLVDWEMACIGDPAWDLAGLISRPLLANEGPDGAWSDELVGVARTLISSYLAAVPMPPAPLAQRLVLFAGAWLLMSIVQYRSSVSDADEPATMRLLRLAEGCLCEARGVTTSLGAAAHAG